MNVINKNRVSKKDKTELNVNVEQLNKYFISVGKNILKQLDPLPAAGTDAQRPSAGDTFPSFEFKQCSYIEIRDIIINLKNKPGLDPYDMNADIIKTVRELILVPLTEIINRSVEEGVFPSVLGLSRVIPIPKSGCTGDPDGLRPIAILPVIAKIFEKVLKNQIMTHFEEYNLFHDGQFGFRQGKSTTLALLHLVNKVIEGEEDREVVGTLFCDLSKAFDCVPPGLLLDRLHRYNFNKKSLELIGSYFANRKQYVTYNGESSSLGVVDCGVPQGSVLGPVLFLIYINEFSAGPGADQVLFADDTTILMRGESEEAVRGRLERARSDAGEWFGRNGLCLNGGKTQELLFTTKPCSQDNKTANAKFLGSYENLKTRYQKRACC